MCHAALRAKTKIAYQTDPNMAKNNPPKDHKKNNIFLIKNIVLDSGWTFLCWFDTQHQRRDAWLIPPTNSFATNVVRSAGLAIRMVLVTSATLMNATHLLMHHITEHGWTWFKLTLMKPTHSLMQLRRPPLRGAPSCGHLLWSFVLFHMHSQLNLKTSNSGPKPSRIGFKDPALTITLKQTETSVLSLIMFDCFDCF